MFQRPHKEVVKARVLEPRRFIQVLFGPRQVGKTTLVTQILREISQPVHFVSADAVSGSDQLWLSQQWEIARQKSKASKATEYLLIIDEIQKIANWSEVVKKEWDADTRNQLSLKVLILGSSRLLFQKGLTESLAGRFETHYLGHWSFAEMREAFGWNAEQYVWFGAYPGAAPLISEPERWKRYVNDALIEASISKDVLMLTRVDKPALLRRLFELGCLFSSQILSYSKVMGQLQDAGNTTTLAHYLDLLNTAGLLGGLEKYSPNVLRQRGSSPRFQVHNMALMSAQAAESFQVIRYAPENWGRWVESAVGAHLLNYALTERFELFYWRERGHEIDFVIQSGNKVLGLEIKSGNRQTAKGAAAFLNKYPEAKVMVVGGDGLSWEDFLLMNPLDLLQ